MDAFEEKFSVYYTLGVGLVSDTETKKENKMSFLLSAMCLTSTCLS